MAPRDTRTGGVLESMILPALERGGYEYETQVNIGTRVGGRRHLVDVIASRENEKFLISLKWQQVGGTAEQKVPFEVISLMDATLKSNEHKKAYLVLGGSGWTLRDFYTNGGLKEFLKYEEKVDILTLEDFIATANSGKL